MSGPVLTLLFLLSILTSIGQIYLGWATNKVTIQAADTQSQYFCTTFNITKHDIASASGNTDNTNGKLFAEFVDKFLQDFDKNYKLCKDWSDLVHSKLMYKIENENSLLDLIINGELKTEFVIKKTLI